MIDRDKVSFSFCSYAIFFFRLLVARVAIHALFFSLHDHYGSTFIVTCGCTIAHVVVPPSNIGDIAMLYKDPQI